MFLAEERICSNLLGLCGKKALNGIKIKAIHDLRLKHFPLERMDTEDSANKDMRYAIDEVCRKTKRTGNTFGHV